MFKSKQLLSVLIWVAVSWLPGCGSNEEPDDSVQAATVPLVQGQPYEYWMFVGAADAEVFRQLGAKVKELALVGLAGESVITIFDCSKQRIVGTATVPYGPAKVRKRNPVFGASYLAIKKFFAQDPADRSSVSLRITEIPMCIEKNRRTELPLRIVLVGDAVYRNPDNPTFDMVEDRYPDVGLIGHPQSPWKTKPFSTDTELALIPVREDWGSNPTHQVRVQEFYQSWFRELNGQLARLTTDVNLACSFKEPFLPDPKRTESPLPVMREATTPVIIAIPTKRPEPKKVDVIPAVASFQRKGSMAYQFEMAGASIEQLKDLSVTIVLVVDGSGSQASNLASIGNVFNRIVSEVPGLVQSLRLGVRVRRTAPDVALEMTDVLPSSPAGDVANQSVRSFFRDVTADGGDEPFVSMLRDGIKTFQRTSRADRELLIFMTDVVTADDSLTVEVAKSEIDQWLAERSSRRFLAVHTGAEGEHRKALRELTRPFRAKLVDGTSKVLDQFIELCRIGLPGAPTVAASPSIEHRQVATEQSTQMPLSP
ncbi:hypothetical protein NHH03_14115 [Stieleria sp. TO1_6]|uniref:hypothetical protein n=1 Tax=Stieleria tagensis TaxID=2956795 RepID=UPI00209B853D|nr:hypothetical protein [Stieleria tagensis]MCO8122879.1 hypothetical protein [Stieleria tagensis]